MATCCELSSIHAGLRGKKVDLNLGIAVMLNYLIPWCSFISFS